MDNLIVKAVDLMGDSVTAAQDSEGIIWVGIRWLCQGVGMSEGQWKRQITNIQKDLLLKRGGSNLILPTESGNQEVFCLQNDYLPIWLAKISITPTMQKERPELADKLLEYQLKAKDILAAAFMPKQSTMPQTVQGQIQLLAQGNVELNKRVDEVDGKVQSVREELEDFKSNIPAFNMDTKDIQNALREKAIAVLGGKKSNAYRDNSIHGYAFADIQIELRRQFGVRRYDQIRHKDVPTALKIIEEYKPPIHIKDKIDMANAQQTLNLEGGAAR